MRRTTKTFVTEKIASITTQTTLNEGKRISGTANIVLITRISGRISLRTQGMEQLAVISEETIGKVGAR